jgi:hypothetical protein
MNRLPVTDEYMHEPTDDPQFNESMYFNFVDSGSGFAVLIRMGNRVNEGHAETTVLIYLPDGGAAIHFERAPITSNDKFEAGGLRFEIVDPLEHMRVTYSGDANRLAKGTDLADPKQALGSSPIVPVELTLDYHSLIPLYGLTGDGGGGMDGANSAIAVGHYQGPCKVSGRVSIDGEVREVNGLGFRDHSWGPRRWQGPSYWRWISCLCDDDNGFVAWVTKLDGNRIPGNGMVLRDGKFAVVDRVDVSSTYGDAPHYPETLDVTLHTVDGASYRATGETFHNVPLRHRRDNQVARLAEIVVKYDFDGVEGHGIAEYHDLIEDGVPIGMHEA